MKIILVRHGDPCKESYSITEKGAAELECLGKTFKTIEIDKIYSANTLRAKESLSSFLKQYNLYKPKIEYLDCLNEFKHSIELVDGVVQFPWEIDSKYWKMEQNIYGYKDCLESNIYRKSELKQEIQLIEKDIFSILQSYGIELDGNVFQDKLHEEKTIFIFSHFATISVMLSFLLKISLFTVLNFFWMAPSSYTTLQSVSDKTSTFFKLVNYGETSHLHGKDCLRSEYGLFMEEK